jgi:O-methyltransferase
MTWEIYPRHCRTEMSKKNLSKLYIETLKSSLLNELYIENEARIVQVLARTLNDQTSTFEDIYFPDSDIQDTILDSKRIGATTTLYKGNPDGSVTPVHQLRNYVELAHTMIGRKRLDNLQYCIEEVISAGIPGDLIETGIWRGGATIFMRGVLAAHGITDRRVWAADSFQGVPPPTHPQDAGWDISARVYPVLSVGLEEVKELFERYGLLDDQVFFLQGWFKDSLPKAPIDKLAVLRLDGDLYESTIDALDPLYAKVERGGFIIVDDFCALPQCERAINDFRSAHGITDPMHQIDQSSVFWRKS